MAAGLTSHVVFACCMLCAAAEIVEWPIAIQALKPSGIRIIFPDIQDVKLYVFRGNVNKYINDEAWEAGSISADVSELTDGRWYYEDLEVSLEPGDVVYYYYYYIKELHGKLYKVDEQSFTVKELVDAATDFDLPLVTCHETPTLVNGQAVCGGQVIFEDNFDTLREDLWTMEQYIPDEPDYTFTSYQHPPAVPTIYVQDGNLRIQPMLQQLRPNNSAQVVTTGTLNLTKGCTSDLAVECYMQSTGASILPPVVSGRITAKSLGFTYGTVKIRAVLPQGDWLYPDILLESKHAKHGPNSFDTGLIRIAGARGNLELKGGDVDYGNKVLYGGVMLNVACRNHLQNRTTKNKSWSNDFHVYSIRWTPDGITFFVDGEEWYRVQPTGSLREVYPEECQLPTPSRHLKMSPFDDNFRITLGVAAGGILEFEDNLVSTNEARKPWKNAGRKALFNFWQNLIGWWPTWKEPALVIDYVRIRAL